MIGRAELRERLAAAAGFVFDLDGTLALSDRRSHGFIPLPGALELLALLRETGRTVVVLTNGTIHPPRRIVEELTRAGFSIPASAMFTPAVVAADFFARKGYRCVLVLGGPGVLEPFTAAGVPFVRPGEPQGAADAVFVGWYPEFTFPDLESACRAVWGGAALYTASNAPFFATREGKTLGVSGAIVAAIHSVTGVRAQVLGKPAAEALRVVARKLGVRARDLVVVGDDPTLEPRMARAAGALALGVTTGLADAAAFAAMPAAQRAHTVLSGVDELLAILTPAR
jgi:NagD protein